MVVREEAGEVRGEGAGRDVRSSSLLLQHAAQVATSFSCAAVYSSLSPLPSARARESPWFPPTRGGACSVLYTRSFHMTVLLSLLLGNQQVKYRPLESCDLANVPSVK